MDDEAVEVPAAVDGAAHDEEADEGPDDRFVVQGAMEGPFGDAPVVANGPAARLACMSVLLTFAGLYVNELSHEQLIELQSLGSMFIRFQTVTVIYPVSS